MGEAIGETLGFAFGVAISPVPIIAVILMLFSARAVGNGVAFLVGWFLGVSLAAGVFYLLADTQQETSDAGPSTVVSVVKLALGALLLLAAVRQWRARPGPGEEPTMPRWMQGIDGFTPVKSFGLAAVLGGVNPKNLALAGAAGATIAGLGLPTGRGIASILLFALVGSVSVGIPVVYRLVAGGRAQGTLDGWKTWLQANNATVMAVLLLLFGVLLIGRAIAELSA